jgi:hypothetical protein
LLDAIEIHPTMKTQRQAQQNAVSALTLIPEELLQPFARAAPKPRPSGVPPRSSNSERAAASVDQPCQGTSIDGTRSPEEAQSPSRNLANP